MFSNLYQTLKYFFKKIISLCLYIGNILVYFFKKIYRKIYRLLYKRKSFFRINRMFALRRSINKKNFNTFPFRYIEVSDIQHFAYLERLAVGGDYDQAYEKEKLTMKLLQGKLFHKTMTSKIRIKTKVPVFDYIVSKYKLNTYRIYFYLIIFYFLFNYLAKYNLFHISSIFEVFKYSNKIIFLESDFNIFLSNYIKDQKSKLYIFNQMIDKSYYLYRVTNAMFVNKALTLKAFKGHIYDNPSVSNTVQYVSYICVYYVKFISENVFTLSNIFLKQYIHCFILFLNKNSYLYFSIYLDYLDYINNLSVNNINLLNYIKDYLFWFSWGIFYNQIFYYYYETYLIENIDLNIYNYFYYKIEILNFLTLKNLKFIDNDLLKDIQKNSSNFFVSVGTRNTFDWFIGEYYKNWIDYLTFNYFKLKNCFINFTIKKYWISFQNYLLGDLIDFYNYNYEHNTFEYYDHIKRLSEDYHIYGVIKRKRLVGKSWLILSESGKPTGDDIYDWLYSLYDE